MRLFMANAYIIVIFGRQRQEELEFKVNLSYVASLRTARVISQKKIMYVCAYFWETAGLELLLVVRP